MKPTPRAWLLVLPAGLIFVVLLFGPLAVLVDESLKPFESGRIGGTEGAGITFLHYVELIAPAYAFYFYDTFRISFIATLVGLLLGYPVAYYVA